MNEVRFASEPEVEAAIEAAFDKLNSADTAEQQAGCEYIGEHFGADAEAKLRAMLAAKAKAVEVPAPPSSFAEERRRREANAAKARERVPSRALVVAQEVLPAVSQDYTIAALNEHHAIIDNVGGKTVIACWEPSPLDPSKLVVVFQSKESFVLRYSNRHVSLDLLNGKTISMPVGHYWLNNRDRRQYRGVTFAPAGPKVINECLNLWQGWGVEEKSGDWGLIRSSHRRCSRKR